MGNDETVKKTTSVCNSAHQINTILLHLLVPILQDGSETGQQVLDGWGHFGHTDYVHYGLEGTENRAQHLGVLLSEILV